MKFINFIWFLFLGINTLKSQIIYFNTTSSDIYALNVATCTATQVFDGHAFNDMAIGQNGDLYELFGQTLFVSNINTGVSTQLPTNLSNPLALATGVEFGPDGLIYLLGSKLWSVDPTTGALTTIGSLPAGWFCTGDLVYQYGSYYAVVTVGGQFKYVQINMTNPSASTIISSTPAPFIGGAAVNNPTCPKQYWFTGSSAGNSIYEYDVNTQVWTPICPGFGFLVGGGGTPADYSFAYNCACVTNAGTVTTSNSTLCLLDYAIINYNNNAILEADDILQYVLFTNANNPLGSILIRSNSTNFYFDPLLMQTGVTYYLATLAGNNVSGQVDLTDPCLDFSNPSTVKWRALPSVAFSATNLNVCVGGCQTINVALTGTPPFFVTYNTPNGSQSQLFPSNTGTLQICPSSNAALGNFNVQATYVSDLYCGCQ
jgi:hypothetical protein